MLTQEVALALGILGVAVRFFVTEKLSADLVAMLVLLALALSGLLTAEEALSGFSHSAVITVMAVFIISEGLFETGVAQLIGRYVTRIAGHSEVRLTVAAHSAINCLPTGVDPVKVSFRTIGLEVSSLPISRVRPVTRLMTPAGTPARSASCAKA